MAKQRNSECWYRFTCGDDCDRCKTFIQMKYQMDNSGLPKHKQQPIELWIDEENECDRQAYKELAEIKASIVDFVKQGKNLYICSRYTGNGKTSWAIKLLHTYFHYTAEGNYENLKGMYISVADILLRLKDFNNPLSPKYKEHIENVDLIIWDDIALTSISAYDYSQLYSMINNRIFAGKSNIFTSNSVDIDELSKLVGAKLASRIYNTSTVIQFKGGDMR